MFLHSATGAVTSLIVTVASQLLWLPLGSVTVSETVFSPTLAQVKLVWLASKLTPQASLEPLFTAAAAALQDIGIAFLELRELKTYGNFGQSDVPRISPEIRKIFKGPLVLNQEYTREMADEDLASGLADAISFGRPYISNPDLVERLRVGAELTPDNYKTWYTPGAEGYTDYPFLERTDA